MRMELCCQLDYEDNENDFEWMKKKLLSLFQPKESEITALVKLYSIRQKHQQNLREFLSEIRIEGYKLLKDLKPEDREKYLVDTYKKGLRNKDLKTALHSKEIETLEEVFNFVKKEKCSKDDCYARQMNTKDEEDIYSEVRELKKDIKSIQSQLESIARILQGLKVAPTQRGTYADAARKRTYEGGYQRMSAMGNWGGVGHFLPNSISTTQI